jgi:hypothetical protein
MGVFFVDASIACGAFGLKAESLFFAGPKKSNPKKWPERLMAMGRVTSPNVHALL